MPSALTQRYSPPRHLSRVARAYYLTKLFPMSDDQKTAKISVRTFLQMWNGLAQLAARTLAPESETAVQLLVAAYEPTSRAIIKAQEKVNKAHIIKAGGKARIRDRLARDEKLERILEQVITIRLPERLLTKADLPAISDDEGDLKNRSGVAAIAAMLGPIYDFGADKKTKALLEPVADSGLDALFAIGDEPVDEQATVEETAAAPAASGPMRPAPAEAES